MHHHSERCDVHTAEKHRACPSDEVRQGDNVLTRNHFPIKVLIMPLGASELTLHDIDGQPVHLGCFDFRAQCPGR